MRHVPLVVAAFETLSEAERAVQALLEAGFHADTIHAVARAGGGRLLLGDRVAVQPVAAAPRLADGDERAVSAAVVGAVAAALTAAAAAFLLRLLGIDPLTALGLSHSPGLAKTVALAACAALVGVAAAFSQRSAGLPHDLALRYGRRLERGDVVLGVRTDSAQRARSVHETLALTGASDSHITRGRLESLGGEVPEAAPSLN